MGTVAALLVQVGDLVAQLKEKLLEPVLKSKEKTEAGGKGGSREEGGRGKEQLGGRDPLQVSPDFCKKYARQKVFFMQYWVVDRLVTM